MSYGKRAMMDLSALILLHYLSIWGVKVTNLGIRPGPNVQVNLGGIL